MKKWCALFVLIGIAYALHAQVVAPGPNLPPFQGQPWFLNLEVNPEFYLPLGSDAELFGYGGGADLGVALRPSSLPWIFGGAKLGYLYLTTQVPGTTLSLVEAGAQAGVHLQIARHLSMRVDGQGGWFLTSLNGGGSGMEGNPWYGGGAALAFDLSSGLALSAGAGYRQHYGLAGGLVGNLGLSYRLPLGPSRIKGSPGLQLLKNDGRGLSFAGIQLDSVYPVFFKHYDDHPMGRLVLHNFETVAARNIKVSVNVRRYMDESKPADAPSEIAPGADADINLYGLFTDSILDIVEATKLPVRITLEYEQYGSVSTDEYTGTLDVLDRNAITWDDDRKAAAFISSKDPEALKLSKGIAAAVRNELNAAVNQNLQAAMAVHEFLRAQKMAYVKDPTSALESNDKQVVDFILFPQQTLGFNSGKCSDLTVLYCSLLESVGISTALITIPGHILMGIDLELNPDEVPKTFLHPEDLIVREGRVWLPLETTDRTEDFVKAWQDGARQWRDGLTRAEAKFYLVHEAWREYQPVVFSGEAPSPPRVDYRRGTAAFKEELSSYISSELGPRVSRLLAEIRKTGGTAVLYNNLGVLYARFGKLEEAEGQFSRALNLQETVAAMFNMGNILFLRGKYSDALAYYSKALKAAPSNPKSLLAVARTSLALGKFEAALASYSKLKTLDPRLAAEYAYLGVSSGDGTRAADADKNRGTVLWQD